MAAGLRKISRGPPGEGAVRKLFFFKDTFFPLRGPKKVYLDKKNFFGPTPPCTSPTWKNFANSRPRA